mgnify:CR=1 FL=1
MKNCFKLGAKYDNDFCTLRSSERYTTYLAPRFSKWQGRPDAAALNLAVASASSSVAHDLDKLDCCTSLYAAKNLSFKPLRSLIKIF